MKATNLSNFRFNLLTFVAKRFSCLRKIPLLPILVDEQIKCITFLLKPSVFFIMSSITQEIKNWKGTTTSYHQFGGLQFNYKGKEIGHLHGNGMLDIKTSKKTKQKALEYTFVEEHHIVKRGSWVSVKINSHSSLEDILFVINLAYEDLK